MNRAPTTRSQDVYGGTVRPQEWLQSKGAETRKGRRLLRLAALVALLLLAIPLGPTPIHAQEEEPDLFTPAEVCEQVTDIFAGMDDRERRIEMQIDQLEEDFEALTILARRYQEYINPNVTSAESNYHNAMFWLAMLRLQGMRNEISQLTATLEQMDFDRDIFTEIAGAFACEEEEEEEPAQTVRIPTSCNVRTGSVINWDKLHQLTFVVVEDPNPAQDDIRWIEFRIALTNDPGQRNPTIWLERAIAWAEEKKSEGWVELARGNVTGFCNAIGAACITPPAGISPNTFERLCGGD